MAPDYSTLDRGRNCNYWAYDPVLRREIRRTMPPDEFERARGRLADIGETIGTTVANNADVVDDHPPKLRTHDRDGKLINEVEYHPAQHENEALVYGAGAVADVFTPPNGDDVPLPLTHNLGVGYLLGAVDIGLGCPVAMTAGAALVLKRHGADIHEPYLAGLVSRNPEKTMEGAMFLTERQGGSDVGATETTASHVDGRIYELSGEKWFCSNIDADVILSLARRTDGPDLSEADEIPDGTEGLSLFLVPRVPGLSEQDELTDTPADRNEYRFRRLKDKLGTRSVPTGEVVFEETTGYLVGEPERGFKYMAEMLNMERLHTAVGSVGTIARAMLESRVHVEHREAFGEPLVEKPLMRRDLVDLTAEHEAAAAVVFDAVRAFDRCYRETGSALQVPDDSDTEAAYGLMRILIPVVKHSAGRLGVDVASAAIEIQGGNGYTGDWVTERLLRDAQVMPVWEGTSNILALDVLRAMARETAHRPVLDRIDTYLSGIDDRLSGAADLVDSHRDRLANAVDYLSSVDQTEAEREAKAFANYLYDVYGAAVLLAEADRDLRGVGYSQRARTSRSEAQSRRSTAENNSPADDESSVPVQDGDARKALVARWFVKRHFRDRDRRVETTSEDSPLAHFDAINYFEQVDPAVLSPRNGKQD